MVKIRYRVKNPGTFTPKKPGGMPSGMLLGDVVNSLGDLYRLDPNSPDPRTREYFEYCLGVLPNSYMTMARCLDPVIHEMALNVAATYAP